MNLADKIYYSFLKSKIGKTVWDEAREIYPDYNLGSEDTYDAVDYILEHMLDWYGKDIDIDNESQLYDMIFDGLT